jgi:hypothetical protein
MSIKIYNAYKLKDSRVLWDFCREVKKEATKNIKDILKVTYNFLEEKENFEEIIRNRYNLEEDTKVELPHISWYIFDKYNSQQTSSTDNSYNFDLFICFYEYNGEIYITPGEGLPVKGTLDFLESRKDLVDYSYWNNTDKPEDISQDEWEKREKIWKNIIEDDAFLVLNICSTDIFYKLDPCMELIKERQNDKSNKNDNETNKDKTETK